MDILRRLFRPKSKPSPDHTSNRQKEDINGQKNNRCLICDDSVGNRFVLGKYLQSKNIPFDEASNGLEALEMVEKNGIYDIIFMDVKMPKMDGLQCTVKLRDYEYVGIIIAVTGYVDTCSNKRALESGVDHILGKPIDKGTLMSYIDRFCR